jgi:hypothetical protein
MLSPCWRSNARQENELHLGGLRAFEVVDAREARTTEADSRSMDADEPMQSELQVLFLL